MDPKYFIGPMSKNVVDAIIEFCNKTENTIGLIPSRRQVEDIGGYVNNWKTNQFAEYVKSRTSNIILQRDHAGPGQGNYNDTGYQSLKLDRKCLDLIHIDPWKQYPNFTDGANWTANMIMFCYDGNRNIQYEIGTEEAIRSFTVTELELLILYLKNTLSDDAFNKIKYLVIQSGTSLSGNTQTGNYDNERLLAMVKLAKKYNFLSKEHNGDYIPVHVINEKFQLGLDAINIAPEFGLIETQTYLDHITDPDIFNEYWKLCYESNRWKKWVPSDFNPQTQKEELIKISGHYVLSDSNFISKIKTKLPNIDTQIKQNIINKLNTLYGY